MFRSALVLLLALPASLASERRLKATKAPTHSGKSSKAVWEKKLTLYPLEDELIFGQSMSSTGGYENNRPPIHPGKKGHRGKPGPHVGKILAENATIQQVSGKTTIKEGTNIAEIVGPALDLPTYHGSEWIGMDSNNDPIHITWANMQGSNVVPQEWVPSEESAWHQLGDGAYALFTGTDHLQNKVQVMTAKKKVIPKGWTVHAPPQKAPAQHTPPQHPGGPSFEPPQLVGSAFIQNGCVGDNCDGHPDPLNYYSIHCTVLQAEYDYGGWVGRNLGENGKERYGKEGLGPNLPTAKITKQMCNIDICHGSDQYDGVDISVPNCFYLRYSGPTDLSIDFMNGKAAEVPKFAATLYGGTGAFSGAKGEAIMEDVEGSISVHIRWIDTKEVNGIFEEDAHVIEYDGLSE